MKKEVKEEAQKAIEVKEIMSGCVLSMMRRCYAEDMPLGDLVKAVAWVYMNPISKEIRIATLHLYGSNTIRHEARDDRREQDKELPERKIDITGEVKKCYEKMYARSADGEAWASDDAILAADDRDIDEMVRAIAEKIWGSKEKEGKASATDEEVLIASGCTAKEAEKHLQEGTIVYGDLAENLESYLTEIDDEDIEEAIREMVAGGKDAPGWRSVKIKGKKYYIEFVG